MANGYLETFEALYQNEFRYNLTQNTEQTIVQLPRILTEYNLKQPDHVEQLLNLLCKDDWFCKFASDDFCQHKNIYHVQRIFATLGKLNTTPLYQLIFINCYSLYLFNQFLCHCPLEQFSSKQKETIISCFESIIKRILEAKKFETRDLTYRDHFQARINNDPDMIFVFTILITIIHFAAAFIYFNINDIIVRHRYGEDYVIIHSLPGMEIIRKTFILPPYALVDSIMPSEYKIYVMQGSYLAMLILSMLYAAIIFLIYGAQQAFVNMKRHQQNLASLASNIKKLFAPEKGNFLKSLNRLLPKETRKKLQEITNTLEKKIAFQELFKGLTGLDLSKELEISYKPTPPLEQ